MAGKIIGFVCCLLCACPLLIIAKLNQKSQDPIPFWSGDTTLKAQIKNVTDYNHEMAHLYHICAIAFMIAGICFLILPIIAILLIGFDLTAGIYLAYRQYIKILKKYS